ncbi:MAG: DUF4214 domain-containing protein [Nostoc sp. NMS7]|uniref:DUF4214 domain-containing protein n=1 Tax=Nostoc sp. NMS7 TaxID=2815391 RepID=UPI0025DDDA33|nr:DUF4214 domain-containing protein [Nostoc sp. NMS7]MBN3947097.1 DUF4214 domain-containing protein [Nostoc sp. NMS7]
MTTATRDLITKLYVSYFDRAPDVSGLDYWVSQANQNVSLETIADSFGGAQEAKDKYNYLAFPNISDPTAFVTSIYLNAFNRQPEAAGLAYWVNLLNTQGSGQASTFILTLIQSAGGADITALQNKITIATQFTNGLLNNNISATPETFTDSTTILNSITSDPTSVTAGNTAVDTKIDSYISAATAGTTTALTTSVFDNLIGTAKNDTIQGANTGTPATDLVQGTDKIDGGAGIDTFQYFGAYGTAAVPTLLNVENVELLSPTSGAIIDFTGKTTGLQEVTIEGLSSTLAAFTAKGLSGITFGVEGTTLTANADPTAIVTTLTADFGSTTTSANLSIKDAAVDTLDLNTGTINAALATLNIAADGLGYNYIDDLTLPTATKSLKITGAGILDLGYSTPITVPTIDASANTGGVYVAVGTVDATFTGGSGNDTLSSALADFNTSDKLDAGAGTTDTLILTGINGILSDPQYAAINAVKNFEVLDLSGTNITVDASKVTAFSNDIFTLTGTAPISNTITVTGATASNTFTLAGTGSYPVGSTANSFDITGTGAANIALQDNATIDALNLTGVTTLNIQSKKQELTTASNLITLGTGLGTATTSTVAIKVAGDSALTIAQPTTSINVNIDATGFKGALTATGGGGDGGTVGTVSTNILTGGDGNDTLTGGGAGTTNTLIGGAGTNRLVAGSGTDVLTGGLGTDTFVFSIAASNAGSFTGGATDTFDTVNSFAQGTDKIELSGNVFSATDLVSQSTVQTAVGNATTLSAALPNAAAAIGAGKFGAFVLGSDTYILGNDATVGTLDKNDLLIKLASTTTLAAGDFTFSASA